MQKEGKRTKRGIKKVEGEKDRENRVRKKEKEYRKLCEQKKNEEIKSRNERSRAGSE